jgi:hypothetical protein
LKNIRADFKKEAEKFDISGEEASVENNDEDDSWMTTIFKKRKTSNLDNEIKRYWLEDVIDRKENPLTFWRLKRKTFPSLASMAQVYLAIPSTSTPSERAFSNGRLIIDYTRNCLSPSKIRALMCLNNWYRNGHC